MVWSEVTTEVWSEVTTDWALGAVFNCPPRNCHVGPVTRAGGFVGKVAGRSSKAAFAVRCGAGLIAAEVAADARGTVAVLFSEANGFACADGGSVAIRGLADGGWYWVVEHGVAAAAPLVAKDVVDNAAVQPWDPGSLDIDVRPLKHGYASLVWDSISGSMSLIPHLQPQRAAAPPAPCGPRRGGGASASQIINKGCLLGDGGTAIALVHGGTFVPPGVTAVRVSRPLSGELEVRLSLWGNGTGHISTATPANPRYGHYVAGAEPLAASSWSMEVELPGATPGVTLSGRLLTISSDEGYCDRRANPPVSVEVRLTVSAEIADPASVPVAPRVDVDANSVASTRRITVRCP